MYQLGTKLQLWDLPKSFHEEVSQITLRGYHTEPPVSLPSDFYSPKLKPLSVDKIARVYCPLRRDLYLEKILRVRNNRSIWGQTAGHLIESYFKNILVAFSELSNNPEKLTYQRIDEFSQAYSDAFWQGRQGYLKELKKKASTSWEEPARLMFLLKQTAKYELLMLGIDYHLRQDDEEFVPITQRISLEFSEANLHIRPNSRLGLSEETTPDFLIRNPVVVMGEVKSGRSIQPYHLNAVAGYALAYESEHENTNVDFGIVYFFETHNDQMNFAQTYVFIIDDFLRRKFLNGRNEVYSLLQGTEPLITQEFRDKHYETLCSKCKFLTNCYPNDR